MKAEITERFIGDGCSAERAADMVEWLFATPESSR
jgi:hypothetical protein